MSNQYNKVIKQGRRRAYLKRKKQAAQAAKVARAAKAAKKEKS
jgi:hypothetical protein